MSFINSSQSGSGEEPLEQEMGSRSETLRQRDQGDPLTLLYTLLQGC